MAGGDPKEPGRAGGDPKEPGRDDAGGDPKEPGRGARASAFNGPGGGWVVVAFISPIGMNVPDLAIGMLGGSPRSPVGGPPSVALADAAVLALQKARKQAKAREEERDFAEKYKRSMKLDDGRPKY